MSTNGRRGRATCECGGSGLFFIPGPTLVGHAILRCKSCNLFDNDLAAAEASGAEFQPLDRGGTEFFVITTEPDEESLIGRINERKLMGPLMLKSKFNLGEVVTASNDYDGQNTIWEGVPFGEFVKKNGLSTTKTKSRRHVLPPPLISVNVSRGIFPKSAIEGCGMCAILIPVPWSQADTVIHIFCPFPTSLHRDASASRWRVLTKKGTKSKGGF